MSKKKRTTVALPESLVEWAKDHDINISKTLESALKNKKKEWEVFGRPGDPDHAVEVIGDISKVSLDEN